MKISHLVLCGGLTFALLLSGCADSNTKTASKKTVTVQRSSQPSLRAKSEQTRMSTGQLSL